MRLERPERRKRSLGHIFDSILTLVTSVSIVSLVSPVPLFPPVSPVSLVLSGPSVPSVPLMSLLHIATYCLFVVRSREMRCITKEDPHGIVQLVQPVGSYF